MVSFGDGIAERTATLRLIGEQRAMQAQGSGSGSGWDGRVKHCKSCKFKDMPTIGQLIEQLELVQNRMENVCTFAGDLDIRAQFGNYNA